MDDIIPFDPNVNDISIVDPLLGRSVMNGATDTCSKCGHTIPDEHVSLILNTGDLMWVYCEECEGPMVVLLYPEVFGSAS